MGRHRRQRSHVACAWSATPTVHLITRDGFCLFMSDACRVSACVCLSESISGLTSANSLRTRPSGTPRALRRSAEDGGGVDFQNENPSCRCRDGGLESSRS